MTIGIVDDELLAQSAITVCDAAGAPCTADVIVDTGYNGELSLNSKLIARLQLPYREDTLSILADGREVVVRSYSAQVIWDGVSRRIEVEQSDDPQLVGMKLLFGYRLTLDVEPGGPVCVLPLE